MEQMIRRMVPNIWCLEQFADRYKGTLEEYKVDKLNKENFNWLIYGLELHRLGFNWERNLPENPSGFALLYYKTFNNKPLYSDWKK